MTPGYDPNKGVDDFRRERDEDEVNSWLEFGCLIRGDKKTIRAYKLEA